MSWERSRIPFTKDTLEVRILANACAEDIALALHVVTSVAVSLGASIEEEEGHSHAIASFRATFDDAWTHALMERTASALAAMAAKDLVTVPGPRRDFFVGNAMLQRLEAGTPGFHERLASAMRRLQWIDGWTVEDSTSNASSDRTRKGCYAASRMLVGGTFVVSVWLPDAEILLAPVDYVGLSSDVKLSDLVAVPWDAITQLAGPHAEPLDEKHLLVRPCSGKAWKTLMSKARAVGLSPEALKARAKGG